MLERDCKESWGPENWCFWTVVLEKTLESSLDSKESQPVHPKDQSWMFIGRTDDEAETPIIWPPDSKSWLIGKDPEAGTNWRLEEKGVTEDEMVGWHHRLYGCEFEYAPAVADGQRSWCAAVHWITQSWTQLSDWTELTSSLTLCNPMGCRTPGSSGLHYLLEFTQIHVHWVTCAI